ncbi:MAG: hypothetical protein IKV92_01570 [Akkermansia sp.]|nr:hypothetical protein [Akkermansia sp.]MBR5875527.1 hypothetical protein [Akkermansia sp.]
MKMIAITVVGAIAAVVLCSCGECDCNSYNRDYLRDVPTSSSQYFD